MALDLDTGRIIWSKQLLPGRCVQLGVFDRSRRGRAAPKEAGRTTTSARPPSSCRPTGGRELLLAGQKSGIVWAFDPEKNGEIMWETRVAQGGINGGVQWGMAGDGEQVYAATSDVVVIRTPTSRDSSIPRSAAD